MRKRMGTKWGWMASALAFVALGASAQNTTTFGNIVSQGVPCGAANCVYYQLPPATPWVVVTVAGTWTGTLETAVTAVPNANYANLSTIAWTALGTSTANGTWSVSTSGATYLRVRATSWTSGEANVTMAAAQSQLPLPNPVMQGTVTASGLKAPAGGSSADCWTTDGGDQPCSGGAASISINGAVVPSANLNGTAPTADGGYTAGIWKVSGSNAIVEVPTVTAGVTSLNGETGAVAVQGDSTITVTPSGQNINLHVTGASSSGVQYNPTTSVYVLAGSSLLRDDNHAMSNAYTVTGGSANGSTCSVTATNTLTTSDWVNLQSVTGFTTPTNGTTQELGTNYTEFKVASATSTAFTLANCNFTATFTGGTAYQATYWIPYQTATKPFFNGHGTVLQFGIYPQGGIYGLCTDQNANYATFYHPLMTTGAGPHYYIANDCHNDFAIGSTASTVETAIEALAVKVHADGGIFVLGTPWSQNFSCPSCSTQANQYYVWEQGFLESNTSPTGQYADFIVPLEPVLGPSTNAQLFADAIGRLTAAGADFAAQTYNFALTTQGNPVLRSDPFSDYRESNAAGSIGRIFTPPADSYTAFAITNAAETENYFNVDTAQGIVTEQRHIVAGNPNNDVENVSNTVTAYDELVKYLCPSLATGWPGNGGAFCVFLMGGTATSAGNSVYSQFDNAGPGNAANEWDLAFSGTTKPAFSMQYNGGVAKVYLPSTAPASGTDCLQIDNTGYITNTGNACVGAGATPTISSGFGTSPFIVAGSGGTSSFTFNVGTGGTATNGVLAMPAAPNGWMCSFNDLSLPIAKQIIMTAETTTTVTLSANSYGGGGTTFGSADYIAGSCFAR